LRIRRLAKLRTLMLLPLLALLPLVGGCGGSAGTADPVVLSFVFMGDGQIGAPGWASTRTENPSSINVPQFSQSIRDIANLSPAPSLTVFGGDLVLNEAPDSGQTLLGQLTGLTAVCQSIPEFARVGFLPLPGNHELLAYDGKVQYPNPSCYGVWTQWLAQNGYDARAGDGPRPTGRNPDALARDESRLTYSFNLGPVHFVVVNTDTLTTELDPATGHPFAAWIPLHWIECDVVTAQHNPAVASIVVLAHRPVQAPAYALAADDENGIMDTPEHPLAADLARVLGENTKVRCLLASHYHGTELAHLQGGRGAAQAIIGNAGAPLLAQWQPAGGQTFGFTLVKVYANGRLGLVAYGRPLPPPPQAFFEALPVAPPPAVPGPEVFVAPRTTP
jgi:hypothetical protein